MRPNVQAAAAIAQSLKERGVKRVYALCGGHIMPIWMAIADKGIEIVDVRDERSAVYMAHASAAMGEDLGVALVTAGPGVTNAMTGIANAHMSRMPVLVISGVPPTPQENRGALQDMSHVDLVRSITRYARTVRHPHAILRELDTAINCARGYLGEPGPAFLDIPVDVQRSPVPQNLLSTEHLKGTPKPSFHACPALLDDAARAIAQSERVLVISGRGANSAAAELITFLSASRAAYLDTGETKGVVPENHGSQIAAMRGSAMTQADLVITVGRKLDFQLAFGSPAVFGNAKFIRVSDSPTELLDNRSSEIALLGDVAATLNGLAQRLEGSGIGGSRNWLAELREAHLARAAKFEAQLDAAEEDAAGRIHPNKLLAEIRKRLDPQAIVIADGGDFLSFARVALNGKSYLDPGPLGCIGIATPFAIGAAKACPERQVVAVTGDGSFGFTAIEVDTAVRHRVPIMLVVSNNGAWAIEVRDQQENFGKVVGTRLQVADHAAMARSFGMKAWRIEHHKDIPDALDEAFATLASGSPVLIDALTSPEAVSSDSKSGLAWVPDYQALEAWDTAERQWLEVGAR